MKEKQYGKADWIGALILAIVMSIGMILAHSAVAERGRTGPATLVANEPFCQDKNWLWIYRQSMFNQDAKRIIKLVDNGHCNAFMSDVTVEVLEWDGKYENAKIKHTSSGNTGWAYKGAIR